MNLFHILAILISLAAVFSIFNHCYLRLPMTIGLMLIALLARFVSVGIPIGLMRRFRSFSPMVVTVLTWGGLRGGRRAGYPSARHACATLPVS